MGIDPVQLRDLVIVPALKDLELYSPSAVNLLLGTVATESDMGRWLKQVNGPALGIFQMEPTTYTDLWWRFPVGKDGERGVYRGPLDPWRLAWDLRYATIYARVKYYLDPEPMPPNDKLALAKYYKRIYNTMLGKGSASKFLDDVERYVGQAWLSPGN